MGENALPLLPGVDLPERVECVFIAPLPEREKLRILGKHQKETAPHRIKRALRRGTGEHGAEESFQVGEIKPMGFCRRGTGQNEKLVSRLKAVCFRLRPWGQSRLFPGAADQPGGLLRAGREYLAVAGQPERYVLVAVILAIHVYVPPWDAFMSVYSLPGGRDRTKKW